MQDDSANVTPTPNATNQENNLFKSPNAYGVLNKNAKGSDQISQSLLSLLYTQFICKDICFANNYSAASSASFCLAKHSLQ